MTTITERKPGISPAYLFIAALLALSSIGVVIVTANDIDLEEVTPSAGLGPEETAYYEYVAPRLDRLVIEMDDVVVMVNGKSRDIMALTVSGNRIDTLTDEIRDYGDEHGVPERFQDVHSVILDATGTATGTFDQARKALRSFNFSGMSDLVDDFTAAADELHVAQDVLGESAGGTNNA